MAKSDMRKYMRTCPVCSQRYAYCSRGCTEYKNLPRFMDTFDRENCSILYNICAGFVNGWLSKEEEANRLKKADLTYFDDLADWMKEAIIEMKKLWKDETTKKVEPEKVETEKVETEKKAEENKGENVGAKSVDDTSNISNKPKNKDGYKQFANKDYNRYGAKK